MWKWIREELGKPFRPWIVIRVVVVVLMLVWALSSGLAGTRNWIGALFVAAVAAFGRKFLKLKIW